MIFRQFYEESLGHASYLVGSEQTGEALVLDVRRDVDLYYDAARRQGLRVAYAADTHQHNDYLTGITALAQRSSTELLASARAKLGYRARPLGDGERLRMGELSFEVLHTPGHTPEHISLVVRDHARGDEPVLLLSGGALLVDDVARPDLLGDKDQIDEAARQLCGSLRDRILTLPDHVLVYPTHVAGSLCGGNIGSMLVTTIGYERRMNRLLRSAVDQRTFLRQCVDLEHLPVVPPYWKRMRAANQRGPEALGVLTEPEALPPEAFSRRMDGGAVVLDCRSPEAFAGGHIPGSLNVGLSSSFPTWAGTVLPADRPVLLVLESPDQLWEVCWHLLRIGYDLPAGWLAGGLKAWRTSAFELRFLTQWTVRDLADHMGDRDLFVLDARQPAEWAAGRVPNAVHIPGGALPQRISEVPTGRPIAVYCGSGYRSTVAASLLLREGRGPVMNVHGGFGAWKARGLPVDR